MNKKYKIYKPYIPERLNIFLDKYEDTISLLFSIVKKFKHHAVDSYSYSKENPPINPRYKYTEKLYIGCILYIEKYSSSWEAFIGPIPGKQVHKRHMEYLKNKVYLDFFNKASAKYFKANEKKNKNNIKYISIDSTISNNKKCKDVNKNNPYNKNRKGLKNIRNS